MMFLAGPISQTPPVLCMARAQRSGHRCLLSVCMCGGKPSQHVLSAVPSCHALTTRGRRPGINAHLSMPGAIAASSHVAQLAAQHKHTTVHTRYRSARVGRAESARRRPRAPEASRQRAAVHYESVVVASEESIAVEGCFFLFHLLGFCFSFSFSVTLPRAYSLVGVLCISSWPAASFTIKARR